MAAQPLKFPSDFFGQNHGCNISGSHNGGYEDFGLLGYNAM
jgi:hypothetical protein